MSNWDHGKIDWIGILFASCVGLLAGETGLSRLPSIPPSEPFTFAVLGDNRGDDTGEQPQAFLEVVEAVDKETPAFVLDSGDMIYGHTPDETRARDQWRRYREAIRPLRAPIFHVPGNHDLWDEPSARLYRELWGKTWYSFDHGNSRFIGLDTETGKGHLGEEQLHWLEQQFEGLSQTNVFVFLHRPLFPVDGAIGSSLDEFPSERDRIHRLFVRNRQVVRGVFAGHEHLYNFRMRDGVPYYISGGGGAPLYIAPELGGFHHFLKVRVQGEQVDVELKRVCAPMAQLQAPRRIALGELLEPWTQGLFWYAWDRTASLELTQEHASSGSRALRLNFDPRQYAWPVLALSLASPLDLTACTELAVDVYVPDGLDGAKSLTPAIQAATKHEAASAWLKPGWNAIKTSLDAEWLPASERRNVNGVEWGFSTESRKPGYVLFDNVRTLRHSPNGEIVSEQLESWERPLLWRVFDETVRAEIAQSKTNDQHGLRLHLNFAECNRPVLFARLNPPWNLTAVKALVLQIQVPDSIPDDLTLALGLKANDADWVSRPLQLRRGTKQIAFELNRGWLPEKYRAGVEQVAFTLESTNTKAAGSIIFQRLSAGSERASEN